MKITTGTVAQRALLIVGLQLLVGCMANQQVQPGDPAYAPVMDLPQRHAPPEAGSLFQAGTGMELFSDRKAHRIGDVITVVLNERTVSQKTNNVSMKKENDTQFDATPLLGATPTFSNGNYSLETAIAHDRDFKGEADADQSNSLQGNITVTVVDVFPNGNLMVRGEKWMTLNRGDEYIRIAGILRPDDITPDNTVQSQKLANARIAYSGTGELADSNKMGWLARFFNSPVWPF